MKVGDYVRTKNLGGSIEKIIEITPKEKTEDLKERYLTDISAKFGIRIKEDDIIKSSPSIIDLIEVGDYVNGEEIIEISENGKVLFYQDYDKTKSIENNSIETIVTKEQLKEMEYKV